MSGRPLECIEVLRWLARYRLSVEVKLDQIRKTRELTDAECEEMDKADDAFNDVVTWINERTGIECSDIWEAAHRLDTPYGLAGHGRRFGKMAEYDGEDQKEARSRLLSDMEYRDLQHILPELAQLDRAGTTAASLPAVLRGYPAVEAGLREAGLLAPQGADGDRGEGGDSGVPQNGDRSGPIMSKEAKALAALADHPEYSKKKIAAVAGCHVKSLNRFPKFKQAWAILQQGRQAVPKGTKNGETGTVEAWDNGDPDNENR